MLSGNAHSQSLLIHVRAHNRAMGVTSSPLGWLWWGIIATGIGNVKILRAQGAVK